MARFKQVTEAFISRKLVEFWGNMVKNYTGDVSDCDFFEILCDHYEHDKAVELIEKAYSAKQLKEMMGGRRRSRVDFDDSLDELFLALWNHAKSRRKCRAVLNTMKADMLADLAKRGDETFERRFLELKRVLKLSDLEFGILLRCLRRHCGRSGLFREDRRRQHGRQCQNGSNLKPHDESDYTTFSARNASGNREHGQGVCIRRERKATWRRQAPRDATRPAGGRPQGH